MCAPGYAISCLVSFQLDSIFMLTFEQASERLDCLQCAMMMAMALLMLQ